MRADAGMGWSRALPPATREAGGGREGSFGSSLRQFVEVWFLLSLSGTRKGRESQLLPLFGLSFAALIGSPHLEGKEARGGLLLLELRQGSTPGDVARTRRGAVPGDKTGADGGPNTTSNVWVVQEPRLPRRAAEQLRPCNVAEKEMQSFQGERPEFQKFEDVSKVLPLERTRTYPPRVPAAMTWTGRDQLRIPERAPRQAEAGRRTPRRGWRCHTRARGVPGRSQTRVRDTLQGWPYPLRTKEGRRGATWKTDV